MKKTSLAIATVGLFVASLLFSFSSDSKGHLRVVQKADAFVLQYAYYLIPCPDNQNYALICGPGSFDGCSNVICP